MNFLKNSISTMNFEEYCLTIEIQSYLNAVLIPIGLYTYLYFFFLTTLSFKKYYFKKSDIMEFIFFSGSCQISKILSRDNMSAYPEIQYISEFLFYVWDSIPYISNEFMERLVDRFKYNI